MPAHASNASVGSAAPACPGVPPLTCASARAQNTMVGDMVWLFCVLLVLTLLGRAAFVFPLSLAHNWYAREQLSFKEMVVIWRAPRSPCLHPIRPPAQPMRRAKCVSSRTLRPASS